MKKSERLKEKAARALGAAAPSDVLSCRVVKKALDARRSKPPRFVYALHLSQGPCYFAGRPAGRSSDSEMERGAGGLPVVCETKEATSCVSVRTGSASPLHDGGPFGKAAKGKIKPVVVVGSGPAGLFAAYRLARNAIPVILLERGRPVEQRVADVRDFWERACSIRKAMSFSAKAARVVPFPTGS